MGVIRKKKKIDPAALDRALERGLEKGGNIIALQAQYNAPKKTGAMAASIKAQLGKDGEYVTVQIGVPKAFKYAVYVHNGTGPHVIRVKTAKVLSDGSNFFGLRVIHPGTPPNPFLSSAYYSKKKVALAQVKAEMKKVFKK